MNVIESFMLQRAVAIDRHGKEPEKLFFFEEKVISPGNISLHVLTITPDELTPEFERQWKFNRIDVRAILPVLVRVGENE